MLGNPTTNCGRQQMLIKIEIPFCPQACAFCLKRVHAADCPEMLDAYADALQREALFAAEDYRDRTVAAMKIGGGIPAHMFDEKLAELIVQMRKQYRFAPDAEITLKTHPGMFSAQTLQTCHSAGIHRLSVEYLTGSGAEAERLGRFLPPRVMNITKLVLGRQSMILSFDVLIGLPGQSWATLRATLEDCVQYGAKQIRLIPFQQKGKPPEAAPQGADQPWAGETAAWLAHQGYAEYLPGRYALPGAAERFQVLRHGGTPVLGLGAGARSAMDGILSQNTEDLRVYCKYAPDPRRITQWVRPMAETETAASM